MSHTYPALSWLSPDALEDLAEAVRITNARDDHITPDDRQRCGGYGCDQCTTCNRPGCKVPVHARDRR